MSLSQDMEYAKPPPKREEDGGRPRLFTDEVIERLPELVELGFSVEEIARQLRTTPASVRSTLSRHRLSLEPGALMTHYRLPLKWETRKLLAAQARRVNMSEEALVERILTLVAEDDLFSAVMDGE